MVHRVCAVAVAICAWVVSSACVSAEAVSQEYLGLEVNANLELAPDHTLAKDGAVVIVHGSGAHLGMETVVSLQRNLRTRGVNSLAITLSLGLPKRVGMMDCKLEQDHRHADAGDEIIAWVEWLQRKGASRVTLIGHSRGASQAALSIVERMDAGVASLVLAAPLHQSDAEIAARYEQSFGKPLAPVLAIARKHVEDGEGDVLMEVPGFMHCSPGKVTAAAFQDYYAPDPQYNVVNLLGQIHIPTMMVLAGDDKLMPELPAALEAARAAGKLPMQLEVASVEGADHFFRDLFNEELADLIADFLKSK